MDTFAFTLAHAQPTQEPAPIDNVEFGIATLLTLYIGFCIALFFYIWRKEKKQADQLIVAPPEVGIELSALPRPLEQLGFEDGHRY